MLNWIEYLHNFRWGSPLDLPIGRILGVHSFPDFMKENFYDKIDEENKLYHEVNIENFIEREVDHAQTLLKPNNSNNLGAVRD